MRTFSWKGSCSSLIIVTIMIFYISVSQSTPITSNEKSSATDSNIARLIKSSMDESANACEDFYKYSCGNWPKNNPRVEGYQVWSPLQIISTDIEPKIERILSRADLSTDSEAVRNARKVYQTCVNTDNIEQAGMKPIKKIIDANGGWPLLMNGQEWEAKNLSWQEIHTNVFKTLTSEALFEIAVNADPKNSSFKRLIFNQPTFFVKRKEFLDSENSSLINAYDTFIREVVQHLQGSDENIDTVNAEIRDIVNFEKALAQISADDYKVDEIDKWYILNTIDEFQTLYNNVAGSSPTSQINWLETCQEMFSISPGFTIDESEQVIAAGKDYLTKLPDVLSKTSPRTIVNYIIWKTIVDFAEHGSGQLKDSLIDFTNARKGVDAISERDCLAGSQMKRAVSYAFMKEYFPLQSKEKATEMMNDLQIGMKEHLQESTWMDDNTKKLTIEKIEAITKFVGYPDDFNDDYVNNYYQDFIPSDNYFENEIRKRIFEVNNELKTFRQPVDKKAWPEEPTSANAFYMATANAIFVPGGILQPPLYEPTRPSWINYAMIGTILGHEISHSLDSTGRQYDKNGNIATWWTHSSIDKYNEQAQCFINQFNNYKIFDDGKTVIPLDGKFTLEENISDTTGVKIAWKAYKKTRGNQTERTNIAGLEAFTDDQIFFLAFANVWCTSEDESYLINNSGADEHSPAKSRVIGTVSNSNEFAKAFNCPINSPENPSQKCII